FLFVVLLTQTLYAAGDDSSSKLRSGPEKVALLELYTSQGCSSCPPADRWLSGLGRNTGLWAQFVPVAFHVDYWDYIGWRDPFSQHRFSLRQRRYAKEGGVGIVYTPAILLDGREWRNWTRGAVPNVVDEAAGILTVKRAAGRLSVSYVPVVQPDAELFANIALLGSGLVSNVTAGENRGQKLLNDFTVLKMEHVTLHRDRESFKTTLSDFEPNKAPVRTALAVWINKSGSQKPLQAVGGWYR
ncbi:MAG: DUF1223 domain-containing protein, partial [Lysobacterales bacterium]